MITTAVITLMTNHALAEVVTPDPAAKRKFSVFTEYLSRDVFIKAGSGLKKVKIGTSFTRVGKLWGKPYRAIQQSLIQPRRWYYRADRSTRVKLTGGDRIETMTFRGTATSPYQTSAGARFGMPLYQVTGLYGGPGVEEEEGSLAYPGKGIRFYFEQGGLRGIEVFSPRKRK
jgi:hypothetical protein